MAYDQANVLTDVKARIGTISTDTSLDPLLLADIKSAEAMLKLLIGEATIPDELSFIIVEVALSKFTAFRAEGLNSKSQDGLSISKFSPDDFDPYKSYIALWLNANEKDDPMNATVRFIGSDCTWTK